MWYGSTLTAATETQVNGTRLTTEMRITRHVSETVSYLSATFSFTDSYFFVL